MSFDRQCADYFAALRWVSGMASSLRPGQLDGPTPCTDWDVRALLGHLIGTAERALATAERRSTSPIPHVVTDIPDAELADAYATLTARITRAWTQLFGDDAVHAPWGVCTAKEAAQGFTIETVTHGWDLAVATDSPSDAPAGVAERCLPITDAAIPARLRGVMYARTVDTDSDASATEQLANLLGRERAAGHGGPCHNVDRRSQPPRKGRPMANRLADSTSPYLRQHADNPVDWFEWGDEAFAEAKRRDVPILLSVGYAACHWCHVMAHDSFERDEVAAVMNEHFVNVKVDREERPDIDAVYMAATTALTGQGGWPMTCLLTPDGKPFYAGTFFPRTQFLALLRAVDEAWRERRDEVLDSSAHISSALASAGSHDAPAGPAPDVAVLDTARERLATEFDATHGGFGGAPKFPPSMVLEFLLRNYERTAEPSALAMAEQTLEAMARGGIYDQLAGGFARYSVDARWIVPHFEKMLYDNALLLRVYLHWWRLRGDPLAERVARETADFLLNELQTDEGGFASALDADTDGVEGLTYVWTPTELDGVLGSEGSAAAELFAVTDAGTFEQGASTLQLPADPTDRRQYENIRAALREARMKRPQPQRDDKVVTAWNGLAIAALAEAGLLLDRRYLTEAQRCARLLLDVHLVHGRLRRTSREGVVGHAIAVAEDYGDLADGLLVLHQATGEARWLAAAGELLDVALARFADGNGGFFDTADDAESLVQRPRDPTDNAAPSGTSAIANALLGYAALTGSPDHRAAGEGALGVVGALGERAPRFVGWALAAAEGLVAGPVQVAVVGDDQQLAHAAWAHRPPGAVVVSGEPDQQGVPMLAGRPLVNGRPAAYVCRGMVCDLPVTTTEELLAQLADR